MAAPSTDDRASILVMVDAARRVAWARAARERAVRASAHLARAQRISSEARRQAAQARRAADGRRRPADPPT